MRACPRRLRARIPAALVAVCTLPACVHEVQVQIPATPAVSLVSDRVAVVADRRCRDIGDQLVESLNGAGLRVDPRADVRVDVLDCGRTLAANVDVRMEQGSDKRRVSIAGQAHALVVVETGGEAVAHLIGSAHTVDQGTWGDLDVFGRSHAMQRALTEGLAADLTRQLSPLPHLAQRRIHPKAPIGSARRMHSDAVLAEVSGDLPRARRLAAQAYAAHPNPRLAEYLQELDSRLQATGLAAPDPPHK